MKHTRLLLLLCAFLFCIQFRAAGRISQDQSLHITCIAETNSYFWVGTNDGIWKVNKRNLHREHLFAGNSMLPSDNVTSICVESDNNIWIGTTAGILRYDNYAFYVVNSMNSNLPDDQVTALACDINNNVWIGTAKGGLVQKLRYGRFTIYNSSNSKLMNNNICSITPDNKGNIWVGLQNDGMAVVQNNRWVTLDPRTGFNGKNIQFVTKDRDAYRMYCSNGDVYEIAGNKIDKRKPGAASGQKLSVRYAVGNTCYWIHENGGAVIAAGLENMENDLTVRDSYLNLDNLLIAKMLVNNP